MQLLDRYRSLFELLITSLLFSSFPAAATFVHCDRYTVEHSAIAKSSAPLSIFRKLSLISGTPAASRSFLRCCTWKFERLRIGTSFFIRFSFIWIIRQRIFMRIRVTANLMVNEIFTWFDESYAKSSQMCLSATIASVTTANVYTNVYLYFNGTRWIIRNSIK